MTVPFSDSMNAISILKKIKSVVDGALSAKAFQSTPHLVLLDKAFYQLKLKPLLGEWLMFFMRSKKLGGVDDKYILT